MKIAVDGFGGDNSPLAVLKGCVMASNEYNVDIIITGDEEKLKSVAAENFISLDKIEIVDAKTVIPVEEDATAIIHKYKDCSMSVGLHLLRDDKADGFVSAGSTGALIVGATAIVGRIKGIKRAALATLVPTLVGKSESYLLIDAGANQECRAEMLTQFGIMGSAYMDKILNRKNAKVALLNIGAEETKGLQLHIDAYGQLKNAPINFIGNLEGRDLPMGKCDVAVTDGFTGNIALKVSEGVALSFNAALKTIFKKSLITKIGALCVKNGIMSLKDKMNASKAGGAPVLGLKKPVIKAHGNSDPEAFKNAIRQTILCIEENVPQEIESALQKLKEEN